MPRRVQLLALGLLVGCGIDVHLGDTDAVVVNPVTVEETFSQAPYGQLDVLFVVDSTGSMSEEQVGIAAAAATFLDALDAMEVAWQVGVTSMDPGGEGALVGRPWILTPVTEDAVGRLADNLQVGTGSPPPSAGLDAAALALADVDSFNLGFRRPDAALHVVFISDGDDGSGATLGEDPPGAFLDRLAAEAARTGHEARASAIVDDGSGACMAEGYDTVPGTTFAAVASASGGNVASICTHDFTEVAEAMAGVGVVGATMFALQADPVEGSMVVDVNDDRSATGWHVDHQIPALVFDVAPPLDARIHVSYTLATDSG